MISHAQQRHYPQSYIDPGHKAVPIKYKLTVFLDKQRRSRQGLENELQHHFQGVCIRIRFLVDAIVYLHFAPFPQINVVLAELHCILFLPQQLLQQRTIALGGFP